MKRNVLSFIVEALALMIVLILTWIYWRVRRLEPIELAWERSAAGNTVPVVPASTSVSFENYLEEADGEERSQW